LAAACGAFHATTIAATEITTATNEIAVAQVQLSSGMSHFPSVA
jgi:hypothetical protein